MTKEFSMPEKKDSGKRAALIFKEPKRVQEDRVDDPGVSPLDVPKASYRHTPNDGPNPE